jgi:hypothetical protein
MRTGADERGERQVIGRLGLTYLAAVSCAWPAKGITALQELAVDCAVDAADLSCSGEDAGEQS